MTPPRKSAGRPERSDARLDKLGEALFLGLTMKEAAKVAGMTPALARYHAHKKKWPLNRRIGRDTRYLIRQNVKKGFSVAEMAGLFRQSPIRIQRIVDKLPQCVPTPSESTTESTSPSPSPPLSECSPSPPLPSASSPKPS